MADPDQARPPALSGTSQAMVEQDAVTRMTLERLAAQDPHGEILSWLLAIAELVRRDR
jgi:hypothetical protein